MQKVTNTTVFLNRALMILVIVAILATALAACGDSDDAALENTAWELEFLSGNDVLPGTTITLQFSDQEVSGSAGCNQYGGAFEAKGKDLGIAGVFSTEMACLGEGIMEQEAQYLGVLGAAARYQVSGDRLEIFDGAGTQILVFIEQPS
jgi:heat shock protein HslJ